VPNPLFAGVFAAGTVGFVNQGTSPATVALPAPTGFVLPQVCAYVVTPSVGADQTDWLVDCGAANNNDARGTLGRALDDQGWFGCGVGLGSAQWRKNGVMIGVQESTLAPGAYPRLSQFARVLPPC